MRKALIIGIDHYPKNPLHGCVNDAIAVANTLEKNGDGSPNFSIRTLTSNEIDVNSGQLSTAISELFTGEADIALLYFAGHGAINPDTNAGYIISQNGSRGALGMPLDEILGLANNAHPNIKSVVIILDCCQSGFAGEIPALGNNKISTLGTGVTILTSCDRNESANEVNGHGIFTNILIDGLSGSSADICGRITPAALYSHVDQSLGPWEQRPIYKANVKSFVVLREVTPRVSFEILRKLPEYFPNSSDIYALDPSFEPDRQNVPKEFKHIPINPDNVRVFQELQKCNRYGLVVPIDAEHMYYAAINSTGCKLTGLGAHYRKLAEMKRI